ncbi:hypothetical protein TNCT_532451 [Trichonephila clavata]|uniref:Uncharacterized protein n=1 Tax=Trichonephila clavata TaxID=2740835 RepID=A0A8X6F048_TRICU|nr:hypothetical protein TNCT_532451 [Trichonephila clavata]
MSDILEMNIAYMRLWPAPSRSARNSLANVRCAEARLFGRGAFYKLGTEHGVLKQLYSRNYSPPRYLLDLCFEGRSVGKLLCGSYNVIIISITVYKHQKFAHDLFLLTLADRPMPYRELAGQTPKSRKDRTLASHCEAILAVSRFGRPTRELADFGLWP